MTGQASYLQSYRASRQSVEQDQASLRELTADNPLQQLRIPGLEWLASQKILRAETIIRRQRSLDFDAASEAGKSGADDVLDDQFQRSVRDLRNEELRLLELRDAAAKWRMGLAKGLMIVATSIGLLIAALAGWSSYHDAVKHNLTGVALRNSEEKYRSLLDGIEEYAVFSLDPAGTIVSWNAGAQRIHLRRPPAGHEWHQIDGNYMLRNQEGTIVSVRQAPHDR